MPKWISNQPVAWTLQDAAIVWVAWQVLASLTTGLLNWLLAGVPEVLSLARSVTYFGLIIVLALGMVALRNRAVEQRWSTDIFTTILVRIPKREWLYIVLSGIAVFVVLQFLFVPIVEYLAQQAGLTPPTPQVEIKERLIKPGLIGVLSILATGFLAPIAEEIMYRGVLLGALQRSLPLHLANVMQSLIFGLAHMHVVVSTATFVLGFALGWLRQRYGVIWPSIVVHVLFNTGAIVGTFLLN